MGKAGAHPNIRKDPNRSRRPVPIQPQRIAAGIAETGAGLSPMTAVGGPTDGPRRKTQGRAADPRYLPETAGPSRRMSLSAQVALEDLGSHEDQELVVVVHTLLALEQTADHRDIAQPGDLLLRK
jgi:hypothetical protein